MLKIFYYDDDFFYFFQMFDLSKETAFNLCLIYKNSGSRDQAALITQKYLRV